MVPAQTAMKSWREGGRVYPSSGDHSWGVCSSSASIAKRVGSGSQRELARLLLLLYACIAHFWDGRQLALRISDARWRARWAFLFSLR